MAIDPATGLPTDDDGNILDATAAGSDLVTEGSQGGLLDPSAPQIASTPSSHPAADVPHPDEWNSVVEGPGMQKQSVDVSHKGMTDHGLKVVGGLQSRADKLAMNDVAQFAPFFQDEAAQAEHIASRQRNALQLETQAHQEHAAKEAELFKAQQTFATEQAELEKHAFAQSQIVRQKYLAGYEQNLMAARLLAMQSGDPMETMSRAQAGGLIAAEAVQGFLKVGGINIDVASQVERFINREIAKHQQRVQDTREGANDQLHLYDLARQGAADEYEARQKYTGMVMEGMKAQMQQEAARFGSSLASANAMQKSAEIDAQLLGVKSNLANRVQGLYMQAEQMRIGQANAMAQLSVEQERNKIEREKNDKLKEAKQHGAITIVDPEGVIDPKTLKPVTNDKGEVKYLSRYRVRQDIDPEIQKAAVKDATELTQGTASVMKSANHVIDLYNQASEVRERHGLRGKSWEFLAKNVGGRDGAIVKRFLDSQNEYVDARVKAFSGAQASDQERERHQSRVYLDGLFDPGDTKKGNEIYADMRQRIVSDYDAKMQVDPRLEPTQEGDPGRENWRPSTFQTTTGIDRATTDGQAPQPTTIDDQAAAIEHSSTKGTFPTSQSWDEFNHAEGGNYTGAPVGKRPDYAVATEALAKIIIDPSTPDDHRKLAREGMNNALNAPGARGAYARWVLQNMAKDPVTQSVVTTGTSPSEEDLAKSPFYKSLGDGFVTLKHAPDASDVPPGVSTYLDKANQ